MTNEYIPTTDESKANQYRNALILGAISIITIGGICYFLEYGSADDVAAKKDETTVFSSVLDQVNTQSVWTERIQNKVKEQEKKTAELSNEVTRLKNQDNQKEIESDPRFQALQKQNQILQEALKTKSEPLGGANEYNGQVFSTTPGGRFRERSNHEVISSDAIGIDNDELNLKSLSKLPNKNPDSFVPSGTFAEAIMLGAADASAGVQAQANPSPMLFRIIANGTLPNHRRSHLKDCVVTAAVVGDISSERGQIRLERMSCTFPNGEIVEQQVEGTVFGMDAKNGVRGNPVWREGALLGRAAVAGSLSGLGSAISQTYTTNSISPLGSTQTVNTGDIFKYGAAQGASNAMEKLAEYNIRRAEQYHPIIQLSAGQSVDVVFLKGFYLDGRKHDESNEQAQEPSQLFPSSINRTTPTGLRLSERELEKIKQHEQAMGWVRSEQGGMQ